MKPHTPIQCYNSEQPTAKRGKQNMSRNKQQGIAQEIVNATRRDDDILQLSIDNLPQQHNYVLKEEPIKTKQTKTQTQQKQERVTSGNDCKVGTNLEQAEAGEGATSYVHVSRRSEVSRARTISTQESTNGTALFARLVDEENP